MSESAMPEGGTGPTVATEVLDGVLPADDRYATEALIAALFASVGADPTAGAVALVADGGTVRVVALEREPCGWCDGAESDCEWCGGTGKDANGRCRLAARVCPGPEGTAT